MATNDFRLPEPLTILDELNAIPHGRMDRGRFTASGTVVFADLEGGFYGIVDDAGERYDPVNLGDEFKSDGLRIRFEAKVLRDRVSVHMRGRLVEILEIERLD